MTTFNDREKSFEKKFAMDEEFKFKNIPGGLILTFPIEHVAEAHDLLRDELNGFVDMAMARVRSRVSLEDHAPEAVLCYRLSCTSRTSGRRLVAALAAQTMRNAAYRPLSARLRPSATRLHTCVRLSGTAFFAQTSPARTF